MWLLELRSTDFSGPTFRRDSLFPQVAHLTGGEVHLPLRQGVVFPGKMRNRADFVAEYSAFAYTLSVANAVLRLAVRCTVVVT